MDIFIEGEVVRPFRPGEDGARVQLLLKTDFSVGQVVQVASSAWYPSFILTS